MERRKISRRDFIKFTTLGIAGGYVSLNAAKSLARGGGGMGGGGMGGEARASLIRRPVLRSSTLSRRPM